MEKLAVSTGSLIDPVCGMKIPPGNPAFVANYQGRSYYFCAEGCLQPLKMPQKSTWTSDLWNRKGRLVVFWTVWPRPTRNSLAVKVFAAANETSVKRDTLSWILRKGDGRFILLSIRFSYDLCLPTFMSEFLPSQSWLPCKTSHWSIFK